MKIERKYENFLLLLFCFLVLAIWALPIWFTPGMTGIYDWDTSMQRYEVLRRTVMEFGQWPGNNPWNTGGVPFLGITYLSLLSVKGLLVLLFGTYWGLRLGILIYVFICFIGSWKLSGIWWESRFIRLIFAFYVTANPALAYHVAVGHSIFQTYCFIPLLIYFLLRFKQDKWSGLKAAIVFGVAFIDSPNYIVQYGLLILGCLYAYFLITNFKSNSKSLFCWIALFIPIVLTLTFYRVVTILQIAIDYSRVSNLEAHYGWISVLKFYLFPYTKLAVIDSCQWCGSTWEVCGYVGIVAFVLTLVSFRQGYRWWHGMIIILVWAGIGNDSIFHIMHWIQKIPTFSSHLCFSRIRIFTLLFFAIAATSGLNHLKIKYENQESWFWRNNFLYVGILMVFEVLLISNIIMQSSHVKFAYTPVNGTKNKFKNISALPRAVKNSESVNFTYDAIRMNLGWLRGYGDSYLPGNTIRIGFDEPGYFGEFYQNGRVEPEFWSPNRILLSGLNPDLPLIVNMNPGSPWYNNGKQLFPKYRIVEMEKPFEVMPDKNGVVELTYRYPGQKSGIIGTVFWLVVSVAVVALYGSNKVKI